MPEAALTKLKPDHVASLAAMLGSSASASAC
jgi:hypothetical protein